MIVIEHPFYLWALLVLIFLTIAYLVWQKQRRVQVSKFGDNELVTQLIQGFSLKKHHLKTILIMTVIGLLIVAWANPQVGTQLEETEDSRADVYIALDISNSMLAQDLSPSRMQRARQTAIMLTKQLKGERIGLIFFAGAAYVQMPLTTDYSSAQAYISAASPDMLSSQGTAIEEAIQIAVGDEEDENRIDKMLIIISDGETHDQQAIDAAKEAKSKGITIYTIGAGTAEGGQIPVIGRDGRIRAKTDRNGQLIVTALNEQMLRDVAKAGGGKYYPLSSGKQLGKVLAIEASRMQRKSYLSKAAQSLETRSAWLLFPALVLLIIYILLPWRKG